MTRIWLGTTALDVDTNLFTQLAQQIMPKENARQSQKERAMRWAYKGFAKLALVFFDEEIVRRHLPVDKPRIPPGVDTVEYFNAYCVAVIAKLTQNMEFIADSYLTEDGRVVITGLSPLAAVAGVAATPALNPPGSAGAGAGSGPGSASAPHRAPRTQAAHDPGGARSSVVRPGNARRRQDTVHKKADRRAPKLLPLGEHLHPRQQGGQ